MVEGNYRAQITDFARSVCAAADYRSALSIVASEICRQIGAQNVLIWLYDDDHRLHREAWRLTSLSGDTVRDIVGAESEIIGEVLASGSSRLLGPYQAQPQSTLLEGTAVDSAVVAPLRDRSRNIGVIEAINKDGGRFTAEDVALLDALSPLAAAAIVARREQDQLSSGMLHAVTRLTQLYDVSQSFNSTIDLTELFPIICNRTASVIDAESSSLWLVEKQQMICREVIGHYRRELIGHAETDAGTVVGETLRDDAPLLINNTNDSRLAQRMAHLADGNVESLICTPVKYEKQWLGVLEVINKRGGGKFVESDVDLLVEIAAQAANSIRNAQRHEAERKVKELQALLNTSREIISSLDLDRVLAVVVNQVATIIPFDVCAIALVSKGEYEIDAIAGEAEVNQKDPKVKQLNAIMDWAGQSGLEVYISEKNGEIDSVRPETVAKFKQHFESSGMKSFYALPLVDEEGPLGLLALESKTSEFLSEAHIELLKIFASQATVAIRNAQLYRQVPLIGALEPLAARKRAFEAMPKFKRIALVSGIAAVLLILVLLPWNLKVSGSAYVMPTRTATVDAEVDGIVDQINYREGDLIPAGAVVAVLRGDEHLLNLNQAKARFDILSREVTRSQAASGAAAAQIERVKLDQAQREVGLYQTKLEQTQIRAPMSGVIVTPRLEEKRGRFIKRGEAFCEEANVDPIIVEIAVSESDIGLVTMGQEIWLKANAYPERKFIGKVTRISPQASLEQDERVFIVRGEIENSGQELRTGMLGRAKILTGSHSIGYVLFRDPARWLRKKVWSWMP
jgi:GAF domain-containing protein/biotin carboxyl carrier protein